MTGDPAREGAPPARGFDPAFEPPAWMRPALSVAEAGFRLGVGVRSLLYDQGVLCAARVDRPVISVGNLAVGGMGKTPFVLLLVARLAARGLRAAVLSRGYGATEAPREPLVVSRGEGPLVDAERAGDEPVLIALRSRAAVVVAARRADAARLAIDRLSADVLLLDDGFQHRALARDLDVVIVDGRTPFANGRLLPRGPLREPPSALDRAHLAVAVVPAEDVAAPALPIEVLRVMVAPASVGAPFGAESSRSPPGWLRGRRVALIAGIARPHRFEALVRQLGAEVVLAQFHPDHARLAPEALARFRREAEARRSEVLLTTEKDAARLGGARAASLGLETLAIEHRLASREDEARLERALDEALARGGKPGGGAAT